MENLVQFLNDMGAVWSRYGASMLLGTRNTILLAVICTIMGCVIGFVVGTVQATPISPRTP
ncbi:amino acid ABC transporter permease, partial [Pseudoflavonifractor phocaeensis]|nr:amino acid ABC transporter permease [Pseudoflavonifractor phocaeensis]